MSIKSRTLRAETDVTEYMADNNLGTSVVSISSNSSGMPVVYYHDASGTPTQLWEGAADGAIGAQGNYGAALTAGQYTSSFVSGLAGFEFLAVVVAVNTNASEATAINVAPRWTNELEPDVATSAEWSREYEPDRSSSPVTYTPIEYQLSIGAPAASYWAVKIPVQGAHCNLVVWATGGALDDADISLIVTR